MLAAIDIITRVTGSTRLTPNMGWLFLAILGFLVVSSVVTAFLEKRRRVQLPEVKLRIRSWWAMLAVFAVGLILGVSFSIVCFAALSFLAFKEFISIVPSRRIDRRILFLAYLAIPVQYLFISLRWYGMFIIWVPVCLFLSIPIFMVTFGRAKHFLRSVAVIHWGMMVTIFALSHVAYLLVLPEKKGVTGSELVLFLVLLTQLNDVAQYLLGKFFGNKKIFPLIISRKTFVGVIGGGISTIIAGCFLGQVITPCNLSQRLLLSTLIAGGGFFGDLIVSAMKRDFGKKEIGPSISEYGGVLDRIGGLFVSAPIFFHALYYLHY